MKKLLILTIAFILSATSVHAVGTDGFATPEAAATAFLQPLMQGIGGVKESVKSLPGEGDKAKDNKLIKEAKKGNEMRPMEASMNSIMRTSGKLMYYRKTSEEIKFGGKMVKQFYDLHFHNGPKKELMLVILQPTMSGGYHIMDAQISDQVSLTPEQSK